MNNQEKDACFPVVSNESGETSKTSSSPLSKNTTFHSFYNSDISQSIFEHSVNRDISDPAKYLDLQRMHIEQRNSIMALKMAEYEKTLNEKDYTIKSLHTNMMNSQNNDYVLTNQYKNIMGTTKLVSDNCIRLNTIFTNICERLNRLGDTVENARTRQKEVMTIVDQTTNMFQEKMLNISYNIDDSLKQVNLEKIKAKQELEVLENRYSNEITSCQINLEEHIKEINNLRSENNFLLEKLNEEKEMALSINTNFGKELKEMESLNALLNDKYESINVKYKDILIENQSLKDELIIMKTSLDVNTNKLDVQLNIIKEQTELLNNLKVTEELNDLLKNDNCSLKERNEYLEKVNTELKDNINNNKLSLNQSEKDETKFKDMCKNYEDLLKMQEDMLVDAMKKLDIQKVNENKAQIQVIDLKQEVEMHNKTIMNLQENVKANHILILNLESTINDLKTDLDNTYQKLQDTAKEYMDEKKELIKEKNELENRSKDQFEKIEKLASNYTKYKLKAKHMYVELTRLRRYQCSQLEQKKNDIPKPETIEIMSDEDNDDVSIVEFIDQNASNLNTSLTSLQSISNKINQKSNCSSTKRPLSLKHVTNINIKKCKTATDIAASQREVTVKQIEGSLNSSFKNINLKHEGKNRNKMEKENNDHSTSNPHKENDKNQGNSSSSNTGTPPVENKKTFKIPDYLKPQKQIGKLSKR